MTTDQAEAPTEVTNPPEQQAPPNQDVQLGEGTPQSASPEATGQDSEAQQGTGSEAQEGTGESTDGPPSLEELLGVEGEAQPTSSQPQSELPGESLEDVQKRTRDGRAAKLAKMVQGQEGKTLQALNGLLAWGKQQGLDENAFAKELTEVLQAHQGDLSDMHASYDDFQEAIHEYTIKDALPEPVAEAVLSRKYSNAKERLEAIYKAAEQTVDAKWNEGFKPGQGRKYFTAKDVEKVRTSAWEAGRAQGRKDQQNGQSGNVANGASSSTQSENEKLLDPNVPQSTKDDILRRRGML